MSDFENELAEMMLKIDKKKQEMMNDILIRQKEIIRYLEKERPQDVLPETHGISREDVRLLFIDEIFNYEHAKKELDCLARLQHSIKLEFDNKKLPNPLFYNLDELYKNHTRIGELQARERERIRRTLGFCPANHPEAGKPGSGTVLNQHQEALLADQEKENQLATHGEASNEMEIDEGDLVEKAHPVVPTDGFIDIPIGSPDPHATISSPSPLPQLEVASLPPSPPPVMDAALQLPPPPPLPHAARLLPPATPHTYATSLPPGFCYQCRRKPCHGWVTDDDEEPKFIRLPSSLDGNISPQHAKPEFTVPPRVRDYDHDGI